MEHEDFHGLRLTLAHVVYPKVELLKAGEPLVTTCCLSAKTRFANSPPNTTVEETPSEFDFLYGYPASIHTETPKALRLQKEPSP